MYVTELVVSDTVNTMPEATIKAMADHGELQGDTVHGTCDAARQVFADLERLGISYHDVMQVIEDEGVAKFGASWSELLNTIRKDMGSSAGPSLDDGSPDRAARQNVLGCLALCAGELPDSMKRVCLGVIDGDDLGQARYLKGAANLW
jgi:Transaldolase/Fructose-6-phosphate aldolase